MPPIEIPAPASLRYVDDRRHPTDELRRMMRPAIEAHRQHVRRHRGRHALSFIMTFVLLYLLILAAKGVFNHSGWIGVVALCSVILSLLMMIGFIIGTEAELRGIENVPWLCCCADICRFMVSGGGRPVLAPDNRISKRSVCERSASAAIDDIPSRTLTAPRRPRSMSPAPMAASAPTPVSMERGDGASTPVVDLEAGLPPDLPDLPPDLPDLEYVPPEDIEAGGGAPPATQCGECDSATDAVGHQNEGEGEGDEGEGEQEAADCALCLEGMYCGDVVRTLPCGHEFHLPCIDRWLKVAQVRRRRCCPMCKADPLPDAAYAFDPAAPKESERATEEEASMEASSSVGDEDISA